MKLEIVEVVTKRESKRFADFPNQLYKSNKLYSRTGKKIYSYGDTVVQKSFFVWNGKKITGRVTVCASAMGLESAFLADFDLTDDKDTAALLLDTAEAFARRLGMKTIERRNSIKYEYAYYNFHLADRGYKEQDKNFIKQL